MSKQTRALGFVQWAESLLAGTGWSVDTVGQAADRDRDDLATAALADGFAAAACGLAEANTRADDAE
ncbi:chemotaxis protein [Mycolicibacterium senegalense]|uniref:chemotaxis protein n=1 Tax=Mycolicibacterium senegalense TaxID=1796 RepID=UPI003AB05485